MQDGFSILHYGRIGALGGIENLLGPFILFDGFETPVHHHLMIRSKQVDTAILNLIESACKSVHYIKKWHGINLPRTPGIFRQLYHTHVIKKIVPDVILNWNSMREDFYHTDSKFIRTIYYEHGNAWTAGHEQQRQEYLSHIDSVVACSHAAKRILQLHWGVTCPVSVCLNGLRPDVVVSTEDSKEFRHDRPLHMGVAAGCRPVKGLSLAVHACAELLQRGLDCELHLAGEGRGEPGLRQVARKLDIENRVKFHGSVTDMTAFYRDVDVLVCPSIYESFGLVCLEAAARGCPVVASKTDGIPEAVKDGIAGFCVEPDLPLAEYLELGGSADDLPVVVYDPVTDSLKLPTILSPAKIADAVCAIIDDADRYRQFSESAISSVTQEFLFPDYAQRLLSILLKHAGH